MTQRADAALVARGLARSRTHAQRLLSKGVVTADGSVIVKPATPVTEGVVLAVADADAYVSRAAHKLLAALDAFPIAVSGRVALDMGASTGGFTQVLRERGADPVIAVDVGHGQLARDVAADPGVVAVEGFNVRHMTPASLAAASGVDARPSVVTGDLSFISLTQVVPAVAATAAGDADVVLLVKPQFEVGRAAIGDGVVTDPRLRAEAVLSVIRAAAAAGVATHGVIASPLAGTHGNREFLLHLRPGDARDPEEWAETVAGLTGER
ncbi:TlyA family RNA methyltransferase [Microbacterium sp. X-17]|uniref:TlyA family RNA methyltransferase n=1 Tax=Microbacterium sp. X-17 TaxID=3144404 RepID=UPI0031F5292F